MKFAFCPNLEKRNGDLLVVPYWEGPKEATDYEDLYALKDFGGKNGECALCHEGGKRILLLGLGMQERASVEALRRAYAAAARFAQSKKVKEIDILFPKCKQEEEFLQGIGEGLLLTNYSFSYKSDEKPVLLEKITFVGIEKNILIERMQIVVDGVNFVRDLVNDNADQKGEQLLEAAKKLHPKVKTTIFDKKKLEQEGMGLILAVNRASVIDPFLIQASYKGNPKSKDHVVLVGKGITYDTGGLSLKPTDGMLEMKSDMAGAATVLGVVKTAAALGLPVNVTAITPVTENCIGSKSYKLGDVYKSYSGKTVEINNTDAEGRLVLGDALAYTVDRLKPSCIIDLATLTGAAIVALGEDISALFSNDEELAEELAESSERTDEPIWHMPIYSDYKEAFKSDIADMVNSGGRPGGAIKAAIFLQEFVGDVPWAHIDIAGPAYLSKPKHYNPTKGTGHGVRFLIDFLERRTQ